MQGRRPCIAVCRIMLLQAGKPERIGDMTINTRDFGVLEINEQEIIRFCSPIYGFEQLDSFVILYDDSIDGPFSWLQSIEQEDVCFILTDPSVAAERYAPVLSKADAKALELAAGEQPVYRVIMVLPENAREATVNLKSPIVINPAKKCAAQVILEEDYPIRAKLMAGEEDASC